MARERSNRNVYIVAARFLAPAVLTPYCLKSFSCNTYGSPRKCCKQKTYDVTKPFRCNTYKKHRGRALVMVNQVSASRIPVPRTTSVASECRPGLDHGERRSTCPNHVGPRITSFESPLHGLPHSLPDATIWCSMTPANPQLSTASRPRVGIPWRTSHEEANQITNKLQYYFAAVTAAEGQPVPVSVELSPNELAARLKELDAFVLPGAPADINPALYHAPRHLKTHDADPKRERTDFAILDHAFASAKPILAICYSCQSLNICLGGTLYQDI